MNASKNASEHCKVFLPDPWTASENAHPQELQPLLDLLRYTSKNYLNTSLPETLQKFVSVIKFFFRQKLIKPLFTEVPNLLKHLNKFKGEMFPYILLFDYLSVQLFLQMREKNNPDFSLIFINSLAHMQHHHWDKADGRADERFHFGLHYLDRIFGMLFDSLGPSDTLVVANALSQKNTKDEKPWILYRQKDQKDFLKKVGVTFQEVEEHMTHDAHIFFASKEDCQRAYQKLGSAKVNDQPLFHIETYPNEPKKLFYKIIFTDKIDETARLNIQGEAYPFFDLFQSVVQRTGKHVQTAQVLSNTSVFPPKIYNHEIFNVLLGLYEEGSSLDKSDENLT